MRKVLLVVKVPKLKFETVSSFQTSEVLNLASKELIQDTAPLQDTALLKAVRVTPKYISNAAEQGLKLLREGRGGDGLTEGTKDAARRMARGQISDDKIILANAWGSRHAVDLEAPKNSDPKDREYPAAGAVAHLLWGINPLDPQPARDWFFKESEKIKKDRLEASSKG